MPARVLHRSPLAWQVTAFMGLQSLLFHITLAWLPDVLVERGMTDVRAGVMVAILNLGGLVGILVAPIWAGRVGDQRWASASPFTLFSLRTTSARDAAAVSGMAHTWGYLLATGDPIVWGGLRDLSTSWTPPLLALLLVAVATTVAGGLAGRDRTLDVDGPG